MEPDYVPVYTTNGQLMAETVKLFLESQGIPAFFVQESAGSTYGLTVGPLGEVEIFVPAAQAEEARKILDEMDQGKLAEDESSLDEENPPE